MQSHYSGGGAITLLFCRTQKWKFCVRTDVAHTVQYVVNIQIEYTFRCQKARRMLSHSLFIAGRMRLRSFRWYFEFRFRTSKSKRWKCSMRPIWMNEKIAHVRIDARIFNCDTCSFEIASWFFVSFCGFLVSSIMTCCARARVHLPISLSTCVWVERAIKFKAPNRTRIQRKTRRINYERF